MFLALKSLLRSFEVETKNRKAAESQIESIKKEIAVLQHQARNIKDLIRQEKRTRGFYSNADESDEESETEEEEEEPERSSSSFGDGISEHDVCLIPIFFFFANPSISLLTRDFYLCKRHQRWRTTLKISRASLLPRPTSLPRFNQKTKSNSSRSLSLLVVNLSSFVISYADIPILVGDHQKSQKAHPTMEQSSRNAASKERITCLIRPLSRS